MKQEIFAIHDSAVNQFNQPFFLTTVDQAKRLFSQQVNQNPTESIYHHAEQFNLYHVGSWDMDLGVFTPMDVPVHLVKASDVKDPKALDRYYSEPKMKELLKEVEKTVERINEQTRQS